MNLRQLRPCVQLPNDHQLCDRVNGIIKHIADNPVEDLKEIGQIYPVIRPLLLYWCLTLPTNSPALAPLQKFIDILDHETAPAEMPGLK